MMRYFPELCYLVGSILFLRDQSQVCSATRTFGSGERLDFLWMGLLPPSIVVPRRAHRPARRHSARRKFYEPKCDQHSAALKPVPHNHNKPTRNPCIFHGSMEFRHLFQHLFSNVFSAFETCAHPLTKCILNYGQKPGRCSNAVALSRKQIKYR